MRRIYIERSKNKYECAFHQTDCGVAIWEYSHFPISDGCKGYCDRHMKELPNSETFKLIFEAVVFQASKDSGGENAK